MDNEYRQPFGWYIVLLLVLASDIVILLLFYQGIGYLILFMVKRNRYLKYLHNIKTVYLDGNSEVAFDGAGNMRAATTSQPDQSVKRRTVVFEKNVTVTTESETKDYQSLEELPAGLRGMVNKMMKNAEFMDSNLSFTIVNDGKCFVITNKQTGAKQKYWSLEEVPAKYQAIFRQILNMNAGG